MKNTIKNKSFQLWPRAAAGAALICCFNAAQGAAESSSFAYRAAIVSAPEAAWLRLQLPPAALAQVQTLDAQDVQVQDAHGQILPVYLAPMTQAARAPAQFSMSYPALPYRQTQAASAAGAKLQLRVQSAGQSIAIDSQDMGTVATTEQAVLLDLRGEKNRWQAVVFDADLPPNQAVQLQLASSRDMQHWQPLSTDGVVYRFAPQASAPALENLRLRLPSAWQPQGQYLRISWAAESAGLQLRSLRGEWAQTQTSPNWARVALGPAQVQSDGALQWSLPFALPLQGLQAHWQDEAASPAALYWPYRLDAKKAANGPWQNQGRGLLWRTPGAQDMDIALTGHWHTLRLQGLHPGAAAPDSAAALQLTALLAPIEVVVLAAQGRPPYTLLVGRRPQRGDAPTVLAPRLQQVQLQQMGLKDWRSLPIAHLGAAQIQPVPQGWWAQTQAAWQQDRRPFVLWAILLAAVALLAGVAWRLAKGVQTRTASDGR